MKRQTSARRLEAWSDLELPGDYVGPIDDDDGKRRVYFLLPIARDDDAPRSARPVHAVTEPPHRFRECPDGSLEIRESIGALRYEPTDGPGDRFTWHGYLDEGNVWREV